MTAPTYRRSYTTHHWIHHRIGRLTRPCALCRRDIPAGTLYADERVLSEDYGWQHARRHIECQQLSAWGVTSADSVHLWMLRELCDRWPNSEIVERIATRYWADVADVATLLGPVSPTTYDASGRPEVRL